MIDARANKTVIKRREKMLLNYQGKYPIEADERFTFGSPVIVKHARGDLKWNGKVYSDAKGKYVFNNGKKSYLLTPEAITNWEKMAAFIKIERVAIAQREIKKDGGWMRLMRNNEVVWETWEEFCLRMKNENLPIYD
jgi:hypothetical protein